MILKTIQHVTKTGERTNRKEFTPAFWQNLLGEHAEEIIKQAHKDALVVFPKHPKTGK